MLKVSVVSRPLLHITLPILAIKHPGYPTEGEAGGGEMNGDQPCAGKVDEVVQLVGIGDPVHSCIQGEGEEEDVRDISPPAQ